MHCACFGRTRARHFPCHQLSLPCVCLLHASTKPCAAVHTVRCHVCGMPLPRACIPGGTACSKILEARRCSRGVRGGLTVMAVFENGQEGLLLLTVSPPRPPRSNLEAARRHAVILGHGCPSNKRKAHWQGQGRPAAVWCAHVRIMASARISTAACNSRDAPIALHVECGIWDLTASERE